MGKKYLETKGNSLESSILGMWEEEADRVDGRTRAYKEHRARLEARRLKAENKKKSMNEGSKEEYEKFFNSALKKFNIDSPADLKSDEEKKKFFNYVDKNYTGEKDEEFGAFIKEKMREGLEDSPNKANSQHLCAKNVVHEEWGEGQPVHGMHAIPDSEGKIAWYDVMFEHGIEKGVSINELNVIKESMHNSHNKDHDEDDDDKKMLSAGKMSQMHQMIKDKKSAEEIAKAMKLDVKTVKALMSNYNMGEGYKPVKNDHYDVKVTLSDREVDKVKSFIMNSSEYNNGEIEDVDSDQVDGGGQAFKGKGDIFIQGDGAGSLGVDLQKKFGSKIKVMGEEVELDEGTKQVLAHGGKGKYKVTKDGDKIEIKFRGKVVGTADFDRGADSFFVSIKGEKGQKSFDDAQAMVDYFAKNKITEEVELDEKSRQLKDPKKEIMVVKNGKVEVIDKKDKEKYMKKGYNLAEGKKYEHGIGKVNSAFEIGTPEYRQHTQSITPGQEITDYQQFKVQSMKEALAKVWGLDEAKKEEKDLTKKVKGSTMTMTGKKSDEIDTKPEIKEK
jgi:hypothetical protein